MADKKKTPVSKLSFSEAVSEVEDIVARLENEQTSLAEEMAGEQPGDFEALNRRFRSIQQELSEMNAQWELAAMELEELG